MQQLLLFEDVLCLPPKKFSQVDRAKPLKLVTQKLVQSLNRLIRILEFQTKFIGRFLCFDYPKIQIHSSCNRCYFAWSNPLHSCFSYAVELIMISECSSIKQRCRLLLQSCDFASFKASYLLGYFCF